MFPLHSEKGKINSQIEKYWNYLSLILFQDDMFIM